MTRTLPPRPSLAQLKHQAKDLRIDARERESKALATLRQLRRFSDASEEDIARAPVALSEAQFALALDYGFPGWPELKRHVEALRSALESEASHANRPSSVVEQDGVTFIEGLERHRWGGGTRRQNSVIATLSLVAERLGDDADYDFLMGASGAAFRIQMAETRLCPSSPHARLGFDCAELAIEAWGRSVEWIDTHGGDEPRRATARTKALASIERGVPALYDHEESSLIVGYTSEGLVLRRYAADHEGYEPMQSWPFAIGIVGADRREPREARDLTGRSLRLAVDLFDVGSVRGYQCGSAAYAKWRDLLRDERARSAMTPEQRFGEALGNAHTAECLADARGAAANYLSQLVDGTPELGEPLRAALELCLSIEQKVREERRALMPFPWELASIEQWSPETRRHQVEFLHELEAIDAAVGARLKEALRVADGARSS